MATNKLWNELLKPATIKRGWHMARADSRQDFAEDLFATDSFAADLEIRTVEIINRLRTHSYQPHPLIAVEVPKGTLAIRPGKVINICDRTVLSSVTCLIAPILDNLLSEHVFSWRVKRPIPKKGSIFKESSLLDLPFLKAKTIQRDLDPFDPWYANWPEFDQASRLAFETDSYRYLATSDIAAYFENIQLPILRDRLLSAVPDEPKLVNLILEFLSFWAQRTDTGRPHLRGIPQGNSISSFLGNIFLMPLDSVFTDLSKTRDIRYQRYMDDVRVFTKDLSDARYCIFLMDKVLRELHLNVQSAKTKIYDESISEISRALVDSRVDELSKAIDTISRALKGSSLSRSDRVKYEKHLNRIGKLKPLGREPIMGARKPLSGLSLRAFQRWIAAHNLIGSNAYVSRLLREIEINPDSRLMNRLIKACRRFPRNSSIETRLMRFIASENNIFKHQEAECIRAIRYLSQFTPSTVAHCKARLTSKSEDSYLRVQSAYLLSRTLLGKTEQTIFRKAFSTDSDPHVQAAICGLLVQDPELNDQVMTLIAYHPNERIRDLGKLFHRMKTDPIFAIAKIDFIFGDAPDWVVCDCMPLLHLASMSSNAAIRERLARSLHRHRKETSIIGLRPILSFLYDRAH